jgi:hypothetical protein
VQFISLLLISHRCNVQNCLQKILKAVPFFIQSKAETVRRKVAPHVPFLLQHSTLCNAARQSGCNACFKAGRVPEYTHVAVQCHCWLFYRFKYKVTLKIPSCSSYRAVNTLRLHSLYIFDQRGCYYGHCSASWMFPNTKFRNMCVFPSPEIKCWRQSLTISGQWQHGQKHLGSVWIAQTTK